MEGTTPGEGGSLKGYLSLCTSCKGQSFFHALLMFYYPGITMNRHNVSIVGLSVIIIVCSMAWEGGNLIMSRGDISSPHLKDTFYIISIHSMS